MSVYVLREGSTSSRGKDSTHKQVWMANNLSAAAARIAIVAHGDYSASYVTSDGYTLDYIEWTQ